MKIPIEDFIGDIISKAQRGLNIGNQKLSKQISLSIDKIKTLKQGAHDEDAISQIADALALHKESLLVSSQKSWYPKTDSIEGLMQSSTPFYDMFVNAYLAWDTVSLQAIVFDTGTDCSQIIDTAKKLNLNIEAVFVTHTHPDHIGDLDNLIKHASNATIYSSKQEPLPNTSIIAENENINCGRLTISPLLTTGHTPGGTTFYVNGLSHPLAITGDVLFAGSIGGVPKDFYINALDQIRSKILSLPENTIICPGHGPKSTVLLEKLHNPFFPEFKR